MTQLPLYDNIVGDWRFYMGSFRDYSGNNNHGTPTGVHFEKRPDKHVRFSGTDVITVADASELQLTQGTIIFYSDTGFANYSSTNRIVSKRDASGINYTLRFNNATSLSMYDGSTTATATINQDADSKSIAVSFNSGSASKAYVNGAFVIDFSIANTWTVDDADLLIGNFYTGANPIQDPLKGVLLYNTVLTDEEIAQAHEWTQEQTSPTYKKRNWYVPSFITGRESGLVAAYDMENVGQYLLDKTNNYNIGEIAGTAGVKTPYGRGLLFYSGSRITVNQSSTINDVTTMSVSFLVKTNSAGESNAGRIMDKQKKIIYTYGSQGIIFNALFDGASNGGWSSPANSVPWGQWTHVVLTYDSSSADNDPTVYINGVSVEMSEVSTPEGSYQSDASNNLIIGNHPTVDRALDGELVDFRMYNKILSQAEVSGLYRQYAKLPYFIDDLQDANESVAEETSDFLSNTGWRIGSGGWKVSRDETNKPREKVIECVTAGILYQESQQAYGTWEFDLLKGVSNNYAIIGFVAAAITAPITTAGSYSIYSDGSNDRLRLYEGNTGAHFSTANDYISASTWYSYRITRRYDGQFTVYYKLSTDTVWTLVDVTGGAGTNPVTDTTNTSSKYLVLDFDASDMVTNFKFYPGVI